MLHSNHDSQRRGLLSHPLNLPPQQICGSVFITSESRLDPAICYLVVCIGRSRVQIPRLLEPQRSLLKKSALVTRQADQSTLTTQMRSTHLALEGHFLLVHCLVLPYRRLLHPVPRTSPSIGTLQCRTPKRP